MEPTRVSPDDDDLAAFKRQISASTAYHSDGIAQDGDSRPASRHGWARRPAASIWLGFFALVGFVVWVVGR